VNIPIGQGPKGGPITKAIPGVPRIRERVKEISNGHEFENKTMALRRRKKFWEGGDLEIPDHSQGIK